MKIGELLELTFQMPLPKIAKERLDIGESAAREALKAAGCQSISGKRGWHYKGNDESVLDRSIYEFSMVKVGTRKPKANSTPTSQPSKKEENSKVNETENRELGNKTNQQENKPTLKKVTYEIEEQLHDELKIMAIREKRNVSEIVNSIIKEALLQQSR